MTVRNRMIKARERAFKKLDSMAVDVVFSSKDAIRYDYTTGITSYTPTNNKVTRGFLIPVKEEMGVSQANPVHTALSNLIVRTEDLISTSYTIATINGVIYHCRKTEEDILVTTLELSDVQ